MIINIIRSANISDVDGIVKLVNCAYRPNENVAGWTHESKIISGDRINAKKITDILKNNNSVIFVGIVQDVICACVQVEKNKNYCLIGMLAVQPLMQSLGYGKQMLEYAEKYSVSVYGLKKVKMLVISERTELISFYQRRGYSRTGLFFEFPTSIGVGIPLADNLKIEYLVKEILYNQGV